MTQAQADQERTEAMETLLRVAALHFQINLHPTNRDGLAQLAILLAQDTVLPKRYPERALILQTALELLREYPQRCSGCQKSRPLREQRGDLRFCAACWPWYEHEYLPLCNDKNGEETTYENHGPTDL